MHYTIYIVGEQRQALWTWARWDRSKGKDRWFSLCCPSTAYDGLNRSTSHNRTFESIRQRKHFPDTLRGDRALPVKSWNGAVYLLVKWIVCKSIEWDTIPTFYCQWNGIEFFRGVMICSRCHTLQPSDVKQHSCPWETSSKKPRNLNPRETPEPSVSMR